METELPFARLQCVLRLPAIAISVNSDKGFKTLKLSRNLSGDVKVDGAYFGGYVKPTIEVKDRKDRRKAVNQSGKRQVVVAMRQRDGRTLTNVTGSEAESVKLVAANVKHSSTIHADEASRWDKLAAYFLIKRINHKKAYSEDGACTNPAESFFSRLRRAEIGIHHKIAGRYRDANAAEMAEREIAATNRTVRSSRR